MDAKIACETLPYSEFPLERALEGIATAGYEYVALYSQHRKTDLLPPEATDARVKDLAATVANSGLQLCLIFASGGDFEKDGALEAYRRRLEVAALMGAPLVMGWGPWEYKSWPDEKFPPEQWAQTSDNWFAGMMQVAPYAEELGVQIVLKPHTGTTAFGKRLREAIQRIGSPAVRVCYDGGNVHFYEGLDPAEDVRDCAEYVTAMCIKDHSGPRANPLFPPPGEGDVDHPAIFRILNEHGFNGPLMVERFEGEYAKADMSLELIDERARAARIYLEEALASV